MKIYEKIKARWGKRVEFKSPLWLEDEAELIIHPTEKVSEEVPCIRRTMPLEQAIEEVPTNSNSKYVVKYTISQEQYFEAYTKGFDWCKKVDNDMKQCDNPYPKKTIQATAWTRGWNSYWNPEWDKEQS